MKTPMKKIIAMAIIAFPFCSRAQFFSGGFVGGISTGKVEITGIDNRFTDIIEGKNIMGYEIGIYGKLQFKPFYVKPQLLYTVRQGELKYIANISGDNGNVTKTVDFTMEKFEVPVLAGMNIIGTKLSVKAGPLYNYVVNVTEKFNENTVETKRNGLGYRAGLASEIGPLMLSLSYQGIANTIGTTKATYKEPNKIIFGLGLILGSTGNK